jgi:hypothetical protein
LIAKRGDQMPITIEEVLNRGFTAWTKNLKISVPFILSVIIIGIIWIAYMFLFIAAVVPSVAPLMADPVMDDIIEAITPHIVYLGGGFAILLIISSLIEVFFTAGAIGMAKDVALTGRTSYEEMINSGKKHFFNLFLFQILFYLIMLAGVVFVIPGILQVGDLTNIDAIMQNLLVLGAGFLLWIIYGIAVSIILAVSYYALVVNDLGPIQALKTGYRFFLNNKAAVVILWLLTIVVVVALNSLGTLFASFEYLSIIWSIISTVLSIVVIPAVFTLWWTFLYMGKTGQDVRDPKKIDEPEISEPESTE